ncbi:MAG: GrpB family protein [Eubacterium sp.]|uniref:GrpB family protein n=1 Tax=Eubacterium sp. TaxID=142586 RepID=UPI0039962B51
MDIQYIGSTAIPEIKAQLIIDISVELTDIERIMSHNEQLQMKDIFIAVQMLNTHFFM